MLARRLGYIAIGGLLALGIVFGGAAVMAQVDDTETTPEETPAETEAETESALPDTDFLGRHGRGARIGSGVHDEELAEALGITIEELEAAREAAYAAAVEQAVTDGLLTQEQADEILESGSGLRRAYAYYGDRHDEFLAEALGISVEELQAARAEVRAAQLAAMVEAGVLTQEEADLIAAQQAVKDRLDYDALNAAAQEAYEAAVAQALSDGVITQEQADALLAATADFNFFGRGGFGGGRGHHRGGGRGAFGGSFSPFQNAQPDATDTGVDA